MMTLVSTRPRSARSLTDQTLVDGLVQIIEEALWIDGRIAGEEGHDLAGRDEGPAPKRVKFCDGSAVAGDDEGRSGLHCPQDLPGVVAQLSLGDLTTGLRHLRSLSPDVLRSATAKVLRGGGPPAGDGKTLET